MLSRDISHHGEDGLLLPAAADQPPERHWLFVVRREGFGAIGLGF